MLPVYIAYFNGNGGRGGRTAMCNELGFVLGFTVVFVAMGAFAGTLGGLLREHQALVNLVYGGTVVALGLDFLGIIKPGIFKGARDAAGPLNRGFLSSLALGIVFSLGWTPYP